MRKISYSYFDSEWPVLARLPAENRPVGCTFCFCFLFIYLLMIPVKPIIISKCTGPIFTKLSRLAVDGESEMSFLMPRQPNFVGSSARVSLDAGD